MEVTMEPIGIVRTEARSVPNHWTVSNVEGTLVIDENYRDGLTGIEPGNRIVVIFHFHKSRPFSRQDLTQHPRGNLSRAKRGVFDICSPVRPNPIGMSAVKLVEVSGNRLRVRDIDVLDGTPLVDIKPYVKRFDAFDVSRCGWLDANRSKRTTDDGRFAGREENGK